MSAASPSTIPARRAKKAAKKRAKKRVKLPALDDICWVSANEVAYFFSVSKTAVYSGESGMGSLISEYLPNSGEKRPTRRFFWPSVVAIHREMMDRATRKELPENVAAIFGRRK